ncbi:MAG: Y-family DNA polymerase [Bacteroidales bacterium]|nr:Y-family DNA polymerase [Bacteroidales bacterium]MDD4031041.1 Y-family DNA polymerase [Bacteroidales bacterium]MDD4435451.1 Y-family DNA polymerase [Bacteroidales bacterium]MDD5733106.1 Y-family DNA polymerase [Bacteroidales bacterium]
MYALADCNNFFVSCERVFNPGLNRRPVIVLSNNDGCAVSRSNEAKALGIKMGVPLYQIRDIVEKHNVVVFSSNFALYGDMSKRVHLTLRQLAPAIEIYSIDEAFLDLRGMEHTDLDAFARQASALCLKNTGIPVSIGVAATKTLAKIASKTCKTRPELKGGYFLHKQEEIDRILPTVPVEDIWGIGRRFSKMLHSYGVQTAAGFVKLPPDWVQKQMSITGLRTWKELQGESCIDFSDHVPPKKQICISRSFAREITDYVKLSEQVSLFTAMVCEKLRKQKSAAFQAIVFVLTNRFKANVPQQYESRLITFPVATSSTLEINRAVLRELSFLFRKGYAYKKAGVILTGIIDDNAVQLDLYDTTDRLKHARLMQVMDQVNTRIGRGTLAMATESAEGIKMNRQHLSPQYTTRWSDIPVVKSSG